MKVVTESNAIETSLSVRKFLIRTDWIFNCGFPFSGSDLAQS